MKKFIVIFLGVFIMSDLTAEESQFDLEYYKNLFKDEYPRHVVSVRNSSVDKIVICSVYDKSWEAEDPLIPRLYMVSANGKKYQPLTDQIPKILKEIGFNPQDEKQARTAALLYFEISRSSQMIINPETDLKAAGIDSETASKISGPIITKKDDVYEIQCYGLFNNSHEVLFRNKAILYSIDAFVFKISKDLYEIQRKPYWNPNQKDSVEELD